MGQAKVTLWADIRLSRRMDEAMELLRGAGEDGRREPGSGPSFSFSIFSRSFSIISSLERLSRRSSAISVLPSSKSSSFGLGPRIQSARRRNRTESELQWNLKKWLSLISLCFKGALHWLGRGRTDFGGNSLKFEKVKIILAEFPFNWI